jgi:phytoene dehydrogenase-like protein
VAAARDIVIIGGGHNALVTAFYLARAGRKPLVLERRAVAGGAALTEEFHPGFRCSTLAHAAGPLAPQVVRDMQLERHGLGWLSPDPRVFSPLPDGRALTFYADHARTAQEIARFSKRDAEKYPEFAAVLERMSALLAQVLTLTPPSFDAVAAGDIWNLLKTGRGFRSLGRQDMFRLLRWAPMAVADFVGEWFSNELLRATIAARGVFGNFLGPWSAGSTAILLLRAASDPHPAGGSIFPRGGMGALAQAMAAAAQAAGAEIRTGADVRQIRVQDGAVTGVVLASGEEIAAKAVVSGADPKRTFLRLIDPVHLAPSFVVKLRNYRANGTTAKVNLALDGVPQFRAAESAAALAGRIHIGPEIDYLERAFDAAKYGDFSPAPWLDVTIPSLTDLSLAPAGKHVMSVCVHFAPYKLRNGDWAAKRGALGDAVIRTLADYAPELRNRILARQIITPLDLEHDWGLTGGHIFHGELALDQLFTMRPLLDYARYRGPLRGLYLCGSGTHPGTGLNGASGANAAREILRDL